ncbi:MAG: nucleoside recognition protein [Desulfarculus sp.]|nr:nucleoside recognition protein [Desulfarculus sp.]
METLAALPATLWQGLQGGLILCLEIALVVVPLLFGYELAAAYGIFERPWPRLKPLLARLGLGPGALMPLLAGLFLGLVYGAGILLSLSDEQDLPRQERLALAVFLVTCHAVVEDTALFMLLGGSALAMLGPRVILAVGLTAWLARRRRS